MLSQMRLVIVEDHSLTRVGLRAALEEHEGIEVVGEAANAAEGLKVVENCHPDVAIIDVGLPDEDGIDLTRKLKQLQADLEESKKTKVLILTMHDSEEAVLAAFAAGADSYCMKGIEFDQLLEALQATHGNSSWIDPEIANIVLRELRAKPSAFNIPKDTQTQETQIEEQEHKEQANENYLLSKRELEILELIVNGASNHDISEKLYITVGTVKTHVRNILNKLCVDDRTEAAVRALRSGLIK